MSELDRSESDDYPHAAEAAERSDPLHLGEDDSWLMGRQDVGEEIDAEEYRWDDLARGLGEIIRAARDTPFIGDELVTARSALHDAQKEITRLRQLNDEQLAVIKTLSEQLDRSSELIGRKDWLMAAIGAGAGLVITGVVPSAIMLPVGVKFFHAIWHLFA